MTIREKVFWWIVLFAVAGLSVGGFVLSFVYDTWLLILVWVPLMCWTKEIWDYIHDEDYHNGN